jgi:WD40 repeat protein
LAATTGFDHMVKVWNLDRPGLLRTFRGHEARATGVAFHPDGTTLVTAGADGTARFWKLPQSSDEWVLDGVSGWSFGFASKNRLLLGLSTKGHIDIWDVVARKRLIHVRGENAVWVPNSERTVFHRGLQLMELDIPSESEQALGAAGESEEGLIGIVCSSDGRLLAWGHGDHAHVFDRTLRVAVARLNTGENRAEQIAFSPDGATLATGGNGSSVIQLWDTSTWRMTKPLEGHRLGIKAIGFSPNGQELASSSADQTTRLWGLSTGEQVVLRDDEGVPTTLAFSPDGRTLAVGTFESSIKLWNVTTGQQIASLEAGASIVHSVNFSPDGSALSSITMDGKVRVWRAPSWAEIAAAEAKEKAEIKQP